MKLKTLNDLQLEYTGDITRIRAEAVKWVKEFRRRRKMKKYSEEEKVGMKGAIAIMIGFHNLTEENLDAKDEGGESK